VWDKLGISFTGTWTGPMYTTHLGTNPDAPGLSEEEAQIIRQAITNGDIIGEDRLVKTKNFYDLSLKLSYEFKLKETSFLEFSIAVKNILNSYQSDFDKGVYRDAGYVYGPQYPRSIYLSVKYGIK